MTARPAPGPPTSGASSPAWWRVAPAVGVMAWGGNHFTPLLVLYRRAEGYSTLVVDVLLAAYIVGLVPTFLLSGPLSDRYGRKPLTAAGLVVGVAGSVVLGLGAAHVVLLCLGRLLSGVSVAVAMVVGSSWIKELSALPAGTAAREPGSGGARAARRASLTLTAGFGLGAGVSGALAQWGPHPTVLPYALQVALCVLAAVPLAGAREARRPDAAVRSLLGDLGVPRAARRRFVRVVLPSAPWVFSTAALAYAVTPSLVAHRVGTDAVAYAALACVVGLGCGAGVQPLAPRIGRAARTSPLVVGLVLSLAGTVACAVEARLLSPAFGIADAAVLGLGYGLCLVAGLQEVQAMAGPHDLAGLTAVFYSLTYVGFTLPVVLAALAHALPYDVLLAVLAAVCAACALVVATGARGRSPARPLAR